MLIKQEKDPTQYNQIKEKPNKTSMQLNRTKEEPNLGSKSAKKVINNASFKSAKDKLDSRAEE